MKGRKLLIAVGCAVVVAFGFSAALPEARGGEKAAAPEKSPVREMRIKGTVEKGTVQGTWVIKVVSPRNKTSTVDVAPDSPKAEELAMLVGKMVVAKGTRAGEKGHETFRVTDVKVVKAKK
jgi:hypothetical protein